MTLAEAMGRANDALAKHIDYYDVAPHEAVWMKHGAMVALDEVRAKLEGAAHLSETEMKDLFKQAQYFGELKGIEYQERLEVIRDSGEYESKYEEMMEQISSIPWIFENGARVALGELECALRKG